MGGGTETFWPKGRGLGAGSLEGGRGAWVERRAGWFLRRFEEGGASDEGRRSGGFGLREADRW